VAPRPHTILTRSEKAQLRHLIESVERETGAEIATLVIPHVDDIDAFATAYFSHFGIGKHGRDNGVLIVVALDPRRIRIEVGRGLGSVVTSPAARTVIEQVMAPAFQAGRYGDGLLGGVAAIAELIQKEAGHPEASHGAS
jgi:uncharacterized protein